jgi:hypothetical protein
MKLQVSAEHYSSTAGSRERRPIVRINELTDHLISWLELPLLALTIVDLISDLVHILVEMQGLNRAPYVNLFTN